LYTPEFKLLAAKGGAQQQGFKYRFEVKNWCPAVSPKFAKTSNIGQKLVQIQISNFQMRKTSFN
jgi:hypothetical protein